MVNIFGKTIVSFNEYIVVRECLNPLEPVHTYHTAHLIHLNLADYIQRLDSYS